MCGCIWATVGKSVALHPVLGSHSCMNVFYRLGSKFTMATFLSLAICELRAPCVTTTTRGVANFLAQALA